MFAKVAFDQVTCKTVIYACNTPNEESVFTFVIEELNLNLTLNLTVKITIKTMRFNKRIREWTDTEEEQKRSRKKSTRKIGWRKRQVKISLARSPSPNRREKRDGNVVFIRCYQKYTDG